MEREATCSRSHGWCEADLGLGAQAISGIWETGLKLVLEMGEGKSFKGRSALWR